MNQSDYNKIEQAILYIEKHFREQPSLDEIAQHLNLSPFHFQKLFTRWAGVSPKKFVQFLTLEYTKTLLKNRQNTTQSTYEAGLSSTSRIHDLFITIEAVSPSEYTKMGKDMIIYYDFFDSLFGECFLAITDKGICGMRFVTTTVESLLIEFQQEWKYAAFIQSKEKTQIYYDQIFSAKNPNPLPVLVKGTNFQLQVWKALLTIPEGTVVTYQDIALMIGQPTASRAVGNAVGNNPISYLIPCHRVINKVGIIGNYRWGSTRKKAMLGWEFSKLMTNDVLCHP